jgi:hypothetical protein
MKIPIESHQAYTKLLTATSGYTRLKGPLSKGCSVCTYTESEYTLSHLIMSLSQISKEERKVSRLASVRAAVQRCRDRQQAIAASQSATPTIAAQPLSLSLRPSPPVVYVSSDSHSSTSSSSSASSASSASTAYPSPMRITTGRQ